MGVSIADKISSKIAPFMRKIQDINVRFFLGTETELLRITWGEMDVMGDRNESLETSLISNAVVKHPFANNVQLFQTVNAQTEQSNANSIDLWEVLPIEIRIPFEGDYITETTALKNGDIIVEILRDEFRNKIPLIMQVTREFGAFKVKQLIGKHFEATLYRGTLPANVQAKIDEYILNS